MKRVRLADGSDVWALNATDARLLHEQIFLNGAYDGHGVQLNPSDTIVDAGANIGLFTRWVLARAPGARVVAVEPNPDVFAALQRNVPPAVAAVCCALGARRETATLRFDRFAASTGTLAESRPVDPARWHAALAADLKLPRFWVAGVELLRRAARREVPCLVRPLSELIAEHRLERIDLLKIDVEGYERPLLDGIGEENWPRIKQLIVETHEAEAIGAVLAARGFQVSAAQEPLETLKVLGLKNVYAVRP